jgi:hypothetical protein
MNLNQQLEQLLPLVTKPGRYIGGELNSVEKDPKDMVTRLRKNLCSCFRYGTADAG